MEVKVYRLDNSLVRKSQLWLVGRRHENHKKELVGMATPYKVYGCRQGSIWRGRIVSLWFAVCGETRKHEIVWEIHPLENKKGEKVYFENKGLKEV